MAGGHKLHGNKSAKRQEKTDETYVQSEDQKEQNKIFLSYCLKTGDWDINANTIEWLKIIETVRPIWPNSFNNYKLDLTLS